MVWRLTSPQSVESAEFNEEKLNCKRGSILHNHTISSPLLLWARGAWLQEVQRISVTFESSVLRTQSTDTCNDLHFTTLSSHSSDLSPKFAYATWKIRKAATEIHCSMPATTHQQYQEIEGIVT